MDFYRCHPSHLIAVRPQAAQARETGFILAPPVLRAIGEHVSLSGFVGSTCIGCAGVVDVGDGVALAWAYLSDDARHYMLPITRKVKRVLDAYPARRIEATVAHGFAQGDRWLDALGFVRVGAVADRPYFPQGHTATLYARDRR